jgi:hypothetical protein
MKKKYRFYFFILIFLFFSSKTFSQGCEGYEYQSFILSARKDFNAKKYKDAEKNIKIAFTKNILPKGKDLDLAMSIAIKTDNVDMVKDMAILLAKGGIPFKYFLKLKNFKWFDEFKSNFKSYNEYYLREYSSELRDRISNLIKEDYVFNLRYHGWIEKKNEMTLSDLTNQAMNIFNEFYCITEEFGFPSEEKTGFFYNSGKNKIEKYNIDALLIHIYQRGELFLFSELNNLVCLGLLDPNIKNVLENINKQFNGVNVGVKGEMERRFKYYSNRK